MSQIIYLTWCTINYVELRQRFESITEPEVVLLHSADRFAFAILALLPLFLFRHFRVFVFLIAALLVAGVTSIFRATSIFIGSFDRQAAWKEMLEWFFLVIPIWLAIVVLSLFCNVKIWKWWNGRSSNIGPA